MKLRQMGHHREGRARIVRVEFLQRGAEGGDRKPVGQGRAAGFGQQGPDGMRTPVPRPSVVGPRVSGA